MSSCPKCKTAIGTWTAMKQTNWSTLVCKGCGVRLRLDGTYMVSLGVFGALAAVGLGRVLNVGMGYGIATIVGLLLLATVIIRRAPAHVVDSSPSSKESP